MTLEFRVFGLAQQMGSKKAFMPKGRNWPIITDTNRNLKSWQLLVSDRPTTPSRSCRCRSAPCCSTAYG